MSLGYSLGVDQLSLVKSVPPLSKQLEKVLIFWEYISYSKENK